MSRRLGFFTRLLEKVPAKQRYQLATAQIQHAERCGFDTAWIAQHHFHQDEGGLPSPLLFLAHVAAHTRTIRLGTAIITLPMENALRVAEDAAVLDLLAEGRLEVKVGSGGTPESFLPFGLTLPGAEQRLTTICIRCSAPGAAIRWAILTIISIPPRRSSPDGCGLPLSRLKARSVLHRVDMG